MIVVTAAGGATGTAVVRELRSRGEAVRAVVSSRGPRPELTALGAQVVVAELTSPMAWSSVLADADALYLVWPALDPEEAEGAPALFAEPRRAGVAPVVHHSVLRSLPHHAGKDRAEEALAGSGLPSWRVLQPCAYADGLDGELAAVRASGVLRSSSACARDLQPPPGARLRGQPPRAHRPARPATAQLRRAPRRPRPGRPGPALLSRPRPGTETVRSARCGGASTRAPRRRRRPGGRSR